MRVFVFGGTQFLGRATVDALLDAGHEVVIFNRGRTKNPFAGRSGLTHVPCDRMGDRLGFRDAVKQQGASDAIIDFVGYQEQFVQDTLEALKPDDGVDASTQYATKHYIFISTDCVYWVQKVPIVDDRLCVEDARDFSQPEFEEHVKHCDKTSVGQYQLCYGTNKLGCERALEEAGAAGLCYTVLRLPDVYGPYDNLGGFWDIVAAVEMQRPIPTQLSDGRMRLDAAPNAQRPDARVRRFSWAFVYDVCSAILACLRNREKVAGATLNIAHEEVISLHETAEIIADAMDIDQSLVCFDEGREAALPSTDFGCLDVARALRLLRPWRPTPMRRAVQQSVKWFLSDKQNRRYHRIVHREPRHYDDSGVKRFECRSHEVPAMWIGSSAARVIPTLEAPVVLVDSFPNFTGQAVLRFMQRLMDHVGEADVECEVQSGGPAGKLERRPYVLRHFASQMLQQSKHGEAFRMDAPDLLAEAGLAGEMRSPLADLRSDAASSSAAPAPDGKGGPQRTLHLGGAGARSTLRRRAAGQDGTAAWSQGSWDVALLGRRRWRFFPPETPAVALCASSGSLESPVDTFVLGPEDQGIHACHAGFAPPVCWECEQTMGDAVVVPHGWWYQTYDDDRTLSVSAWYGPAISDAEERWDEADAEPEVIEYEVVD